MITIENMSYAYDKPLVLDDVNITIEDDVLLGLVAGECIASVVVASEVVAFVVHFRANDHRIVEVIIGRDGVVAVAEALVEVFETCILSNEFQFHFA